MNVNRNKSWFFSFALVLVMIIGAPAAKGDFITALNEQNIRQFLETTRTMSNARQHYLSDDEVAGYFNRHLADNGVFKSNTRYEMPGFPIQDAEMELRKNEFITMIEEGQDLLEDYETSLEVKSLAIARSRRSAVVKTVITETGKLSWPDNQGQLQLIPVEGTSECEQQLAISLTNHIQMTGADCTTLVRFSPFSGRPLGE